MLGWIKQAFYKMELKIAVCSLLLFAEILHTNCEPHKPWIPSKDGHWNSTYFDIKHSADLQILQDNSKSEGSKISIIFLGDSITDLWTVDNFGKSIWEQEYEPKGAVNFGIGGDRTEHLLWRVQNTSEELSALKPPPKLIVLCIGTNNIGIKNVTGEDIAKGVAEITKTLREILPQTKILLLGLFPRQTMWHFMGVADINLRIARLDILNYPSISNGTVGTDSDDSKIRFLDMWTHFAEGFGQVVNQYFVPDQLHLNSEGYSKWSQLMKPMLDEMLL